METNNRNQPYFEDAVTLTEPHFDEETTVLSARPVVPLEKIKDEENSRKRLLIGFAMACSLMLGALAATFVYRQRGQVQAAAIGTAVPGAAGIAVEQPVNSAPAAGNIRGAVGGASPESETPTVEKKLPSSVSPRAAPIVAETKLKVSDSPELENRGLIRAERINEQRLRHRLERQARRDSGGRQRKPADDLLRIRDIFEGPTRP